MWRRHFGLIPLAALVLALPLLWAQTTGPFNEREVRKQVNVQDVILGDQLWALDFKFKDPRLLTVNVPGRGKKVVWYLWYQVINNTKEPRYFIPHFELVTLDKHSVHKDQVIPFAEEAIKRIEDPTGYLEIKNSVSIARNPVPVTKADSAPRTVTGIAMWDDVFGAMPDTVRFSIFASGLSNGISEDDNGTVRLKTLQLNFRRLSDRNNIDSEVKFVSPAEWIYRASPYKLPKDKEVLMEKKGEPKEEKKDEKKKDDAKKDDAKKDDAKKDDAKKDEKKDEKKDDAKKDDVKKDEKKDEK